jgi:chromosome segregation ATPase
MSIEEKHEDLAALYVDMRAKLQVVTEEKEELQARNAALEENATYMENRLEERQDELVAMSKQLDEADNKVGQQASELFELRRDAKVRDRECEALRAANTNLLDEVQELQRDCAKLNHRLDNMHKDYDILADANDLNGEKAYDAEEKAEELEADNARLRRALLEQATVFATTLKAILPA